MYGAMRCHSSLERESGNKQITPKVMINLIVAGNGSPAIRRAFEPFPAFILQVLFLQQLKNFIRRVDDGLAGSG
jgi:hypothetical protein